MMRWRRRRRALAGLRALDPGPVRGPASKATTVARIVPSMPDYTAGLTDDQMGRLLEMLDEPDDNGGWP